MNVMNRKMFANRDARQRLANMGGIVASSPELLGTAQTFAPGGQVSVPVKTKTVIIGDPLGGTEYELYSDGSAILVSSGTKIDPNNASNQTFLQMLQDLPDVSDTSDMSQPPVIEEPKLDSAPITEDERGIFSNIVDIVKKDFSNFPKLPDSREAKEELIRGELADQIRRDGLPSIATPDDENPMIKLIESGIDSVKTPFEPDKTNNPPNPYQSDIDAAVESFTQSTIDGNLDGPIKKSGSTLSGSNFTLPPTEGYPYPKDAPEVVEEEFEQIRDSMDAVPEAGSKQEKNIQEQINDVNKKVKKEVEKPDGGNANDVASSGLLEVVGVDTSNMGLKERVQSMQEMMSELVGYSDEDEKKQFWLTMAGIGFQIASGQSSKALVNIAEGLAQGAKKFSENQATRQARKDKLGITALGEVLADDRATRKFGRDLQIAKVRASASSTDKYTAERERSRIKELIYKSPFDYPGLLDDKGNLNPSSVNTYLDQVIEIADAEPVVMTEDMAREQAVNALKIRPDLREVILKRLKEKGFSTKDL